MRHSAQPLLPTGRAGLNWIEDRRKRWQQDAEAFRAAKARFEAAAAIARDTYASDLTQERIDIAARQGTIMLGVLLAAERDRMQALGVRLCAEAGLDYRTLRGKLLLGRLVSQLTLDVFRCFDLHGHTSGGHPGARFPLP